MANESANENVSAPSSEEGFTPLPLWVGYLEISYLTVIVLIGVPGNILILLVQRQNREKSSTDILIAAIAVFELVCSGCNAPLKILMNTRLWIFIMSDSICRFHIFIVYTTTFASTYLLAAVAIDRYVKTCRPLSTIYTTRRSKIICCIVSVIGFITSILPSIVFELDNRHDCSAAMAYRKWLSFWDMAIIASTIIIFGIFVFSYVNIAIALHKRKRVPEKKQNTTQVENDQSTFTSVLRKFRSVKVGPLSKSACETENKVIEAAGCSSSNGKGLEDAESNQQDSSMSANRVLSKSVDRRRNHRPTTLAGETVNRTTLMLFLLTLIYAVTFTMTNIFVMTADAIIGRTMEKLCKSILMINCITNPVFFFCMSSKYRAVAKSLVWKRRR